jgi:hypothetical protein
VTRLRSQLRQGRWPETRTSVEPVELTIAARRQAEAAIAELSRIGVRVGLDGAGRARFSGKMAPVAARIIERMGDLIEAYLAERL